MPSCWVATCCWRSCSVCSTVLIGSLAVLVASVGPLGVLGAGEEEVPAAQDKLAPLAAFVGGEWATRGYWSNGEELRARNIFAWGVGKKIIKVRTYATRSDGEEYLRYEAVMAWHPRKKSLVEISFAYDGRIQEYILEPAGDDTLRIGWTPYYEGDQPKIRQTLRFVGRDRFVWQVFARAEDGWEQLIESTWHRREATGSR